MYSVVINAISPSVIKILFRTNGAKLKREVRQGISDSFKYSPILCVYSVRPVSKIFWLLIISSELNKCIHI